MRVLTIIYLAFYTCTAGGQIITPEQRKVMSGLNTLNNQPFLLPSMEDEQGIMFDTARLRGKTVYVDFWFTTCPPCLAELPFSKALENFFAADTTVLFLKICVENIEQKPVWKQMVVKQELKGINLFYAKNQPQSINLLRRYQVNDYPTYLLVDNFKIIGYRVPRPSNIGAVHWMITCAATGQSASESYLQVLQNTNRWLEFNKTNRKQMDELAPK